MAAPPQGQSLATIDKERRIGAALAVGMQITSSNFAGKGYRYWHFDANCGPGWNDAVGVPGSPLVFWQVAEAYLSGVAPAPFFCDINREAMAELAKRLAANHTATRSVLLPGDNQEAIEVFAECIRRSERPRFAVGSALIDPNGYYYRDRNGVGAPVAALDWFCREFLRIDLILNLNIRTYQLQKSQGHAVLPPRELLRSLGKKHWLVGRAYVDSARFVLAIGRNVPTRDHRSLGLFSMESPEAHAILTIAEGKTQHDLPDVPRVFAPPGISRSSRRRNEAGRRPVSELRGAGNGSASPPRIPALGDVRRPVEPQADLPPLPLFGARQG